MQTNWCQISIDFAPIQSSAEQQQHQLAASISSLCSSTKINNILQLQSSQDLTQGESCNQLLLLDAQTMNPGQVKRVDFMMDLQGLYLQAADSYSL